MVIYHTERALPAVTRAYDPTPDQKIVGSGNEDEVLRIALYLNAKTQTFIPYNIWEYKA